MKRLLIYITILTTLFSGGIALTSAIGKTAPPPAFAQWFTYPNGTPCPMPCLFGIRPGVTRDNEINTFLITHFLTRCLVSDKGNPSATESTYGYYIYRCEGKFLDVPDLGIEVDDNIVLSVDFNFENHHFDTPTIGHVWTQFGIPQRVALSTSPNYREGVFTYLDNTLMFSWDDRQLYCTFRSYSDITSIYVLGESSLLGRSHPWIGASRSKYAGEYYYDEPLIYETACTP